MNINNYRGTVNDRPIDTPIVEPAQQLPQLPAQQHNFLEQPGYTQPRTPKPPEYSPPFMERILSQLNDRNVIPVADLPVYNKGN